MYCATCNADDPPHAPGCRAPDGELHRIYRDAEELQRAVMAGASGGHSSGPLAIAALAERIKQRCLWEIAAQTKRSATAPVAREDGVES